MTKRFPLSRGQRVRKRGDFKFIQSGGRKLNAQHFLILLQRSEGPLSRIGITVSTKVDRRSVVRNRLKRFIREAFRLNCHALKDVFDIVVIARQNAANCSVQDVQSEVVGALRAHGFSS